MLVISSRSDAEARRLSQQSTLIEPSRLTDREVAVVNSIDGAILLDQAGTCRAIGVILDGPATEKGDPSRGARGTTRRFATFPRMGTAVSLSW